MSVVFKKFKSGKFAECAEKTSYVNKQITMQITMQASEKSK
jgi:hypothetical protein